MKNEILKILLKNREERSISESLKLIGFWRNCDLPSLKYAWMLNNELSTK
jgi:hypothetical protein